MPIAPFPQTRAGRCGSVVRASGRLPRQAVRETQGVHQRLGLKAGRSRTIKEVKCMSMEFSRSGGLFVCPMLAMWLLKDDMCFTSTGYGTTIRAQFRRASLLVLVYTVNQSVLKCSDIECYNMYISLNDRRYSGHMLDATGA